MSLNGVVIFGNGLTELAFYRAIVKTTITDPACKSTFKILYENLNNGTENIQTRVTRIFNNNVQQVHPDTIFDVVLCYDTGTFAYSQKPPVNWYNLDKELKISGANNVYHVKASESIEDWFLVDLPGILRYLSLPHETILTGYNGLDRLQALFIKAKDVYVKGCKNNGFIDHLDIEKIIISKSSELKPLFCALRV